MLTEREKQIALNAYWTTPDIQPGVYAAVEAVLAHRERTSPASEPAGDVVEAFESLYHRVETGELSWKGFVTAAYQIAIAERDKQWEKAIQEECFGAKTTFVEACRNRLSQPVETLQEKVGKAIDRHLDGCAPMLATDIMAAKIIALVRAELEKESK